MVLPGEHESGEGSPCYILDPEGRYLGQAAIPNARASIVRGHLLATIEDNETGEQIPMVYRIVPTVEGLKYP